MVRARGEVDKVMTKRTVNLDTAATILDIKKDTLRKRLQRGTIEAVKDRSGKWQVVIDDEMNQGRDSEQDKRDNKRDSVQDNQDSPLIEHLRSEIDYLRQENYRKDSIIIELTKRVPLIEGPRERKVPWYRKLFIFNRSGENDRE